MFCSNTQAVSQEVFLPLVIANRWIVRSLTLSFRNTYRFTASQKLPKEFMTCRSAQLGELLKREISTVGTVGLSLRTPFSVTCSSDILGLQ